RFGHGLQNVKERADFSNTDLGGDQPSVAIDLTKVYADQVTALRRTVKLTGNSIEIVDEWAGAEHEYRWQMITAAEAAVNGNTVALKQAGKMLTLTAESAGSITIRIEESAALCKPHDSPHPGIRRIDITSKSRDGKLRVMCS